MKQNSSRRERFAGILGLTYGLNQSTNLMGEWDYVGDTFETGSAYVDLYFESVTNSVPFGSDQGYIQLEVEGDFSDEVN